MELVKSILQKLLNNKHLLTINGLFLLKESYYPKNTPTRAIPKEIKGCAPQGFSPMVTAESFLTRFGSLSIFFSLEFSFLYGSFYVSS